MNCDANKRERNQESAKREKSNNSVQERPAIDYMAKDYQSFRLLILDRLSQTNPIWKEANLADIGLALVELLAYVGDQLSYYQDAVATEAYLGTARSRVSVNRHARLLGYYVHEGHNARTWVCFDVKAPTTVPKETKLLTDSRDGKSVCVTPSEYEGLRETEFVFETEFTKRMYPNLNKINFHLFEKSATCLPEGSTSAVLQNENNVLFETLCSECDLESQQDRFREVFRENFNQKWVDAHSIIELRENRIIVKNQEGTHQADFKLTCDDATPLRIDDKIIRNLYIQKDNNGKKSVCFLTLNPGDIVIFEEITNSETVYADMSKRWAVRLTDVKPRICEKTQKHVVEIQWMKEDATPFPLKLENPTPGKGVFTSTIVRGNVVLADHGDTKTKIITLQGDDKQIDFCETHVTHSTKYNSLEAANKIGLTSPPDSLPIIYLFELNRGDKEKEKWLPGKDLLFCDRSRKQFKLEIDDEGNSKFLFKFPLGAEISTFEAIYRIGNGSAGNIGANAINRIVDNPLADFSHVAGVSNPLPAIGGVDQEDVETVRHIAPAKIVRSRADSNCNPKSYSKGIIDKNIDKPKCLKSNGPFRHHKNSIIVYNTPGLNALTYRVGTYSSFKQSMFYGLHECYNFRGIDFLKSDDFVVAFLDAWATVADVLTFYQEKIANEGYLRTATERRSIIELNKFIGRGLSTGVAANTFLAFEIEENLDTNEKMKVPVGTKVQNILTQNKKPRIFETIEEIEVRPDWNHIKPCRIVRHPQDLQKEDSIEIDAMSEGLCKGRYIALSGKIDEVSKKKAEVVRIKKIIKKEKIVVLLCDKIKTDFKVDTVKINANVAKATHGETVSEVLGGGDPTLSYQEFKLKYKPLTYINAQGKRGRTSTLQLFVEGILWKEVPSLYNSQPTDLDYVVEHDEYGNTLIRFGDGKRGALPHRGTDNIVANYRVGMGTEGMLNEGQLRVLFDKPFGIRSVSNPLATTNARDPESVSEVKKKILPHLMTVGGRAASKDLENHAPECDARQDIGRTDESCAHNKLYRLLPAIYRERDAELNYPLKELLGIIEEQMDIIEEDIAQLYDNWFIETCEPWIIPYIGDLLGVKLPYSNEDDYERNRAIVANSIKCFSCIEDDTYKARGTNKHLE
jgi:hypothetical protein